MNKHELRKWLEEHTGREWDEERSRLIEENPEVAREVLRDALREVVAHLTTAVTEAMIDHDVDEMTEFPEVRELLKKF
jgi:hypothetical protein